MPRAGLVAAFAASLALVVSHAGAQAPKSGAANEAQLMELRGRIDKLQRELAAAEESRGGALDELRAAEKAVSESNRALFELATAERQIQGEIVDLGKRSQAARDAIASQEAAAERLLRMQYVQGAPDRLRLLLEGRDAAELARHLAYYGYIQRARADLIVRLRQGALEVEALEREKRSRAVALTENQEGQQREAKRLAEERAARAAMVQRLAGDISRSKREIGRLKKDEARLSKLLQEIARQLAARPTPQPAKPSKGRAVDSVADASLASQPFATLRGRLKLPVRGELAGRYGSPREEGGATWKGLFIKAPSGETVHAVADGQVVYADWLRGFGNLLILDHGRAYMSLYAYNEGLLRQVGERVRSGDPVARVGDSGGAGESGLYFELRQDGKPFDPMRWVAP